MPLDFIDPSADPPPLNLPEAFQFLFEPARYKVARGGRGGAKSESFARALVAFAHTEPGDIGCFREFQSSIKDSVHKLLSDSIESMGLASAFRVTEQSITDLVHGNRFLFKGLRRDVQEIKSLKGIKRAWVEEAQATSAFSWEILTPTIREPESEIWVSYNQMNDDDPTHVLVEQWKANPKLYDAIVREVSWRDNPWFPEVLNRERRAMLAIDPEAYQHVWEGSTRKLSDAIIFNKRVRFETFDTPLDAEFFHGMDFGFANDPNALVRSFIKDNVLHIDREAFGWGVELDDTPALMAGGPCASDPNIIYKGIETARDWPIKADSARPETISYLRRQGFRISAAEKWDGCVEDGVTHLKGFKSIVVHATQCPRIGQEFRLYSWKVDKNRKGENGEMGLILPIIVDKHNHGIDAVRYSLDGYIQNRGGLAMWERLAQ